jgi:hypothetical protein
MIFRVKTTYHSTRNHHYLPEAESHINHHLTEPQHRECTELGKVRARLLAESGATEELARMRAEMLKASNSSKGAAKASEDALRVRLTDTEGQLAKYDKDIQALRAECSELQKKLAERELRETKLTQALVRPRNHTHKLCHGIHQHIVVRKCIHTHQYIHIRIHMAGCYPHAI